MVRKAHDRLTLILASGAAVTPYCARHDISMALVVVMVLAAAVDRPQRLHDFASRHFRIKLFDITSFSASAMA